MLEEENVDDNPPRNTPSMKAAWWSWPLVLASVLGLAVLVPALENAQREGNGTAAGESVGTAEAAHDDSSGSERDHAPSQLPEPDWAQLAIFKIQSKILIGLTRANPANAADSLRELDAMAEGVHLVAASEIVKRFALSSPGDKGETGENSEAPGAGDRDQQWQASVESFDGAERAFLEQLGDNLDQGAEPEELAYYREHLDWFAELLPVRIDGEKRPPPESEGIRLRSTAVAVGSGLLILAAFGAVLVGLILLVLYLVFRNTNPGFDRFRPDASASPAHHPGGILLECFALYLGLMALGAVLAHLTGFPVSLLTLPGAVVVGLLWPKLRGHSWRDLRRALGWTRGRGLLHEAGAGLVGYLGILPIVACGVAITMLLGVLSETISSADPAEPPAGENAPASTENGEVSDDGSADGDSTPQRSMHTRTTHPVVGWLARGGLWVTLLCLFLASVFAPVVEETFFRGALHRHLRGRWSFLPAALLGSVVFAVIHPQGWMAVPALTAMGTGFCLIREWRDSLIAPMTAHAVNNGIIVGLLSLVL